MKDRELALDTLAVVIMFTLGYAFIALGFCY